MAYSEKHLGKGLKKKSQKSQTFSPLLLFIYWLIYLHDYVFICYTVADLYFVVLK